MFFAQILFGLLAATQFIFPGFLYEILDFSVNRMIHINAMIVWMLYGFIGCVYWFLEDESGTEIVGLKLGNIAFWVFTGAATLVVLVYLFSNSQFKTLGFKLGIAEIMSSNWTRIHFPLILIGSRYVLLATELRPVIRTTKQAR